LKGSNYIVRVGQVGNYRQGNPTRERGEGGGQEDRLSRNRLGRFNNGNLSSKGIKGGWSMNWGWVWGVTVEKKEQKRDWQKRSFRNVLQRKDQKLPKVDGPAGEGRDDKNKRHKQRKVVLL